MVLSPRCPEGTDRRTHDLKHRIPLQPKEVPRPQKGARTRLTRPLSEIEVEPTRVRGDRTCRSRLGRRTTSGRTVLHGYLSCGVEESGMNHDSVLTLQVRPRKQVPCDTRSRVLQGWTFREGPGGTVGMGVRPPRVRRQGVPVIRPWGPTTTDAKSAPPWSRALGSSGQQTATAQSQPSLRKPRESPGTEPGTPPSRPRRGPGETVRVSE